jgi:hypothetical protein
MKRSIFCVVLLALAVYAMGDDTFTFGIEAHGDFNFNNADAPDRLADLEFIRGFDNRPLLDLDVGLRYGGFNFLAQLSFLSLRPAILVDMNSVFTNMVKLSYLEYDNGFVYLSAGRRKQSMGATGSNLFVNADMPFYDGVNVSMGKERGLRFDSLFSWASLTRYSTDENTGLYNWTTSNYHSNYFEYHAFSWTGETFFVMLAEAAVIADPDSLSDFGPFAIFHNEHARKLNVGLDVQFAKTLASNRILLYGTVGVDDLPTPASSAGTDAEGKIRQTDAAAFALGAKWKVFDGTPFAYPSVDRDRGIRRNPDVGRWDKGGLTVSVDYTAASRWMYKKSQGWLSPGGDNFFLGQMSFHNYFYMPALAADEDWFAVPYGFVYGGDSQLIALKADWQTERWKVSGSLQILLQGWEARETAANLDNMGGATISADPDSPRYSIDWLSSGDIQPKIMFRIGAEYGILPWLTAYGGVYLEFSSYDPFYFNFSIGASMRF